jgi:glycogen operon protein
MRSASRTKKAGRLQTTLTLPAHKRGLRKRPILDTAAATRSTTSVRLLKGGVQYDVEARSIVVLVLQDK